MDYVEFFNLAYQNIREYIIVAVLLFFIQYFLVRKFCIGGMLDPFHITYTFTYSTSYAVVFLLWHNGYVEDQMFIMLLTYGVLFLFSLRVLMFSGAKFNKMTYTFRSLINVNSSSLAVGIIACIYFLLTLVIIKNKGFSLFSSSNRFEDNKGIGPLVKFWVYSSYFIVAYLAIFFYKTKNDLKRKLIAFYLVVYIIFNCVINGAKADFVMYSLACLYAQAVFNGKTTYKLKHILYILLFGLSFIFIVLYFNFNETFNDQDDIIDVFNAIFIRFTDRVLSNGDMYYLGLPYNVIEKISVDNFFVTLFSPLLSISVLSSLAGYDVSSLDLGRQLLTFHYSGYEVAGGPTDHFDLFAYKYFGYAGGLFIIFLSVYIYMLKVIVKSGMSDHYLSSVYTVLWFSILSVILKPGMLLSSVLLPLIFFVFIGLLCRLFNVYGYRNENSNF